MAKQLIMRISSYTCFNDFVLSYVEHGFSKFWCYGARVEVDHYNLRSPTINKNQKK